MITLGSLVTEITSIRNAVDLIEIKGHTNAAYVSYVYEKCNQLINEINSAAKEIEENDKAQEEQNETEIETDLEG